MNSLQHALDTGITVCGGYAKLFYKLAQEAGYDVYYISTGFFGNHAYNAILFEGTWYFFDITWYDDSDRNSKWLSSPVQWGDSAHISSPEVYKMNTDYDTHGKTIGTFKNGKLQRKLFQNGFEALYEDGKVMITGYTGRSDTVIIPATIEGLPVTGINGGAFSHRSNFTGITSLLADADNKLFTSRDGVLFSKNGDRIIRYPVGKQKKQYAIPAGITSIGDDAFSHCTGLTTISIPAGVTSIGSDAFWNCTGLTGFTVDPSSSAYTSRDGVLFNKKGDTLIKYPVGKKEKQYAIPAGVTSIRGSAFNGCTGLTSINIPAGVTSIGYSAFNGCTGLTSVSIPASVTSIGDSAFSGCTGLTSISIGANVEVWYGNDFSRSYRYTGRKAGVYTFRNGAWSYSER
jgi:GH24 family phage-related lysozyme (muramidase)